MWHDSNDVITVDTIKSIFQEKFQQQEHFLIETVNSASLVTNQRIDKLSSDITLNNEKLIKLANDVSDVQLSIEALREMINEKIKKIEERISKEKQRNMEHYEKLGDDNKMLKDKNYETSKTDRVGITYVLMGLENMRMNHEMILKRF